MEFDTWIQMYMGEFRNCAGTFFSLCMHAKKTTEKNGIMPTRSLPSSPRTITGTKSKRFSKRETPPSSPRPRVSFPTMIPGVHYSPPTLSLSPNTTPRPRTPPTPLKSTSASTKEKNKFAATVLAARSPSASPVKTRPKSPGARCSPPRGDSIKSPLRMNQAKSPLRKAESPGRSKSPGGRAKSPAPEYPSPLQEVRELLDSTMLARRLDTTVLSSEISRLEKELRAVHEARARDAAAQEAQTQALLAQFASSLSTAETERRRLEAEATTARLQLGQAEEAARAKLDAMEKKLEREAMAEALMAREAAERRDERAGYPPNRHALRVSSRASGFVTGLSGASLHQRRPRRDSTLTYLPNGGKFAIVEVRAPHYEPYYEPARTGGRWPPNPPPPPPPTPPSNPPPHAAHDLPNGTLRAPAVWSGTAFFDTRDRTWVEMQPAEKLP